MATLFSDPGINCLVCVCVRACIRASVRVPFAVLFFNQDKAQELAVKRVEIDTLDENVQKLMEVSLDEDCTETKSGLLELHQLFDAVIELLKNRIMAARDAAGLGPLNLEELLAELADLNEWLKAVEKWLIGQENESENFSDPTKAEQQRQKYEVRISGVMIQSTISSVYTKFSLHYVQCTQVSSVYTKFGLHKFSLHKFSLH